MLLALDTSGEHCLVCLGDDQELLVSYRFRAERSHSASLLPMIREVLRRTGLSRQELSAIAATCGPGSYTGLRIGLTAAACLAYACSIPFYPVSTLDAHAWMYPDWQGILSPMLDARNRRIYTAAYHFRSMDGVPELVMDTEAQAIPLADWLHRLRQHAISDRQLLLTGNAARLYAADIRSGLQEVAHRVVLHQDSLQAEGLWRAALHAWRSSMPIDPRQAGAIQPIYLGQAVKA